MGNETLTVLGADACWDLLAGEEVGRLAVAVAGQPDIFPVNFAVVDSSIVFRTGEGTKLLAVVVGPAVAFEADGYDPGEGVAWSVVVKGWAEEVPTYEQLEEFAYPVFPWSATPKGRFVRIRPTEISGRRFTVVAGRQPQPH
jgi:nitroimidazol reductase NimA-like FMN-containing flavoprotein (pyridoxamine 5'-phosphate oxidase superfamily)